MDYARTHMSHHIFLRLYPLEIDDDNGQDETRLRTKITRQELNRKRNSERAALTITAPNKKQRTKRGTHNTWSSDPRMIEAVQKWFSDGPILDSAQQKMSMVSFAKMKGLPATTFKYYVHKDPNKRRKLGVPCGRKPLISNKTSDVLCEVAIRHDRANMGLTPAQLEDKMQLVAPHLSHKQIQNHRSRTFRNKHKHRLNPKSVMPQKTSSRRSQCTVAQQYRWFQTFDRSLDILRAKNTGLCKKSGLPFEEVMEHFLIGLDEACLIADADGNIKILGEFGRRKHEKKVSDCRASSTLVRTGVFSGTNGPTCFLMAGINRRTGYDDDYLLRYGCAPGSQILMTENAFMTEECWERMTPKLVAGYRSLPYIKENPDWFCLEIFDRFGPHYSSLEAMKHRYDNKVLSTKEEGDSSSINQVTSIFDLFLICMHVQTLTLIVSQSTQMYDNQTARSDKREQRKTLAILRQMKGSNNFVDQWDLIACGIQAVKYTTEHPEVWINSAIAVNLHPKFRIPFGEWCKKIEPFMTAADSFKLVVGNQIDRYTLLPVIWQAISPDHKRRAMAIYEEHNKEWDVDCITTMMKDLVVNFNDIKAIQMGLWHALDDPTHLDRGMEDIEFTHCAIVPIEVANAEKARKKATEGLRAYELTPEGLSGSEFLDHAISFRLREYSDKQKDVSFSFPINSNILHFKIISHYLL